MVDINLKTSKMWSRFGSRAVYGQALLALAENNPDLLALSADLGTSSGLAPFMRKYPEKFFNIGIAEQNMVGVAAGLAKEGFIPFISSFAPFLSMRASEQIRMELGYMKHNVKVVALGSGLSLNFLGNSHYGLEDISMMRSIPSLTVVSPADCAEIFKAIEAAYKHKGPVYIRLTGETNNPIVYKDNYNFELGKSILLKDGEDLLIVACGTMVARALEAAEMLENEGTSCAVLNMHTIKPMDKDRLDQLSKKKKLIVSIEEHTIYGGLGSAIAEHFSFHKDSPRHLILGLPDNFGPTAEYEYLLKHYRLNGEGIFNSIKKALRKVKYDK